MALVDLEETVRDLCDGVFTGHAIRDGLQYQRIDRVVSSNGVAEGDKVVIRALVQGSARKPYAVQVDVERRRRDFHIKGRCSCLVGFNCKHVVAALADVLGKAGSLEALAQTGRSFDLPETTEEAKAASLNNGARAWMESLTRQEPPPRKVTSPKTIYYVITANPQGRVELQVKHAPMHKDGRIGKVTVTSPDISQNSRLPAADLELLRQLAAVGSPYSNSHTLRGEFGAAMLSKLVATGRCYFNEVIAGEALKIGAPRPGSLGWDLLDDGSQKTTVRLDPAAQVLKLSPIWYVDPITHECGFVRIDQRIETVERWLNADPVTAEASVTMAREIRRINLPAPRELPVIIRRHMKPRAVLKLRHMELESPISRYIETGNGRYGEVTEEQVDAIQVLRFEMDYGGIRVDYFSDERFIERLHEGRLERIERHMMAEEAFYAQLCEYNLQEAMEVYDYQLPDDHDDDLTLDSPGEWLMFVATDLPKLKEAGWIIEMDPGFPHQPAEIGEWYSETIAEGGGNDWFSIELGIMVDGKPVNLLPMIREMLDQLEYLRKQNPRPSQLALRIPDGRCIQLPTERVFSIAETLAELYDPQALVSDKLKVGRLRAAELSNLVGAGHWKGNEELRTLARQIEAYRGIAPADPPAGLQATLRPYQQEGLAWLQFLREFGFGGILADDMGLGKTVQMLAHLLAEKESGRANLPSLVIAPTSLMSNWRAEAERFTPSLHVLVSHGGERKEHFERLAEYDLIVTSYSLLPRDEEILKKQPFHLVILDEAQYVKNPNTKWAEVARSLSARHRLCMTGTPMENHLGELWSLMTFLSPGYLGNQQQFGRAYRTPIEKHNDPDRRRNLAQRLRPFILRRKKEEVALDLPPKTEIQRTVELEGAQRDLYETIRLAMHERVQAEIARKGMARSQIIILDALLKLRQVCCDPRLVKLERARKVAESAKLAMLLEMLPKMIEEGRRVLLFSQFTSMLDLIEPEIRKRKIGFVRLTGETTDRGTPVRRFQAGEVPLFLISLKAGGTGLNLTAADTVIHYDPWWNPAVEQQATDRAHRIGQVKPVFVYKLVTRGTVEEKIVAMQQKKKELVASLLGEGAQQNIRLSREELEHLFDPISS